MNSKLLKIAASSLLLILIIFFLYSNTKSRLGFVGGNYSEVYALVSDKVSQDAAIVINLPKGVSKEGAEKFVKFYPELSGKWIPSGSDKTLAYLPSEKPEVGMRYNLKFSNSQGDITKDFVFDENPRVVEIFPKSGSEANENSDITIVFSRPMIPLTSLNKIDESKLPITIHPQTDGKFKWISTRTLQFIPTNRLHYSSNYSVKILSGFTSTDGVSVEPSEYKFVTRPIRYESMTSGTILYNQPFEIRFNVPINLEKTKLALKVVDNSTGFPVSTIVEYGKRLDSGLDGKPRRVIVDRSVVAVYPMSDKNGRSRVWNFLGNYSATLDNAYSIDGDIELDTKIPNASFKVTDVIKSVSVKSERTNLASSSLFDPQGSIAVSFYEEVNLNKTKYEMKGVRAVSYGEKCKETKNFGGYYNYGQKCEKEDDKSTLVFTFNSSEFSIGESVPMEFTSVMNLSGEQINTKPVIVPITVYPKLVVSQITPATGINGKSLTTLFVCSNSPIITKTAKNYREAITTTSYFIFNRFDRSYVFAGDTKYYKSGVPCNIGEFVTTIHYGLHPNLDYSFNLKLSDVFGQGISHDLKFHTGQPELVTRNFINLQKTYNVTTPDRTKFVYGVENMETVNLHICKTDPATMIEYLNSQPGRNQSNENLKCLESKSSVINLPAKYWVNNYFTVDLKTYFVNPLGHFVISFSHPSYVDYNGSVIYDRTFVSVTNMAVGAKKTQWSKYDTMFQFTKQASLRTENFANLFWVINSKTLEAIPDALVKVYQQVGNDMKAITMADSVTTDKSGVAEFELIQDVAGATVTFGNDSAIISSWTDNLNYGGYANSNRMLYVYTDRPIYRPNQVVNVKGIYRFMFDGNYEIFKDKEIPLSIFDPKGEKVLEQKLSLNNYGTFTTKLTLSPTSALGMYRIDVLGNSSYFDVEEYKASAFEVNALSSKDEYVAGDVADISITGKYYFGVPLSGGTMDYTFTAQDFYFDRYKDEYFNFGGGWYNCYRCGYGDTYISGGKTELSSSGDAKISLALDFAKLFKDDATKKSKIVVFHGTIKDINGKSVSFEKSFIVHQGQYYIGAKVEPYFAPVNQDVLLRIKTVDVNGKPVSKSGIKYTVNKVEWKSVKRQEVDGGFYNNWEQVYTKVANDKAHTDSQGNGNITLSFKDSGEYKITLVGQDGKDNEISTEANVYVYGDGVASVKPDNNSTLDVAVEKTDLRVGEKAKIIIKSPYIGAKALITLERGRIFKYDIVTINKSFFEYEIPIEDNYAPNIFVSVLLVSSDPEVKFGQVELKVNTARKVLNIDVVPDKTTYLPGEKVVLKVKTTNYLGQPESADVSIAVADLSVLALKGNPKKNPIVFFYNGLPLTVTTASNIKNILHEAEVPTGTKGGSGGGGDADDLAVKKRGEFKDTAFWEGQLITDANGNGTVTFKLPDNLTRWQIESVGVTGDTKVGVNYKEITANKRVMAVPLAPRFIVPGDKFSIGVQVFNQTENSQDLGVSLQSSSLSLNNSSSKSVSIRAGESKTLYFEVTAPLSFEEGSHIFTLSAKNNEFNDTVEGIIPVRRNMTYESTATAGTAVNGKAVEYVYVPEELLADRGGVTVRAQASLAVFMTDALSYLAQFPYGCSEQMASKLSMLATLKNVNKLNTVAGEITIPKVEFDGKKYSIDDAVEMGLGKIYQNQDSTGGFSYYQGLKPNVHLSIAIIDTLQNLKEAGYSIRQNAIDSARNYVANTLANKGLSYYKQHPYETDSLVTAVYVLSRGGEYVTSLDTVQGYLLSLATTAYINEKISSSALAYLATLSSKDSKFAGISSKVWKSLENRISNDSRGAYLKPNADNVQYDYYETPERNTALAIKAFSTAGRSSSQSDNMLRFLIAGRDKNGAWGSTSSTLAVVDAMTARIKETGDAKTNFTLDVKLDGQTQATHQFAGKNIFEPFEKFLPIVSFAPEMNHQVALEVPATSAQPARFYYDLGFTYYLPIEKIPPRDEGITIERAYYSLTDTKKEKPLNEARVGEVLLGEIKIITPKPRPLFAVEGYIPAGMELVNFNLATEDKSVIDSQKGAVGSNTTQSSFVGRKSSIFSLLTASPSNAFDGLPEIYAEDLNKQNNIRTLYPDFSELRDDRLFLFSQNLEAGEYVYQFYVRATTPGQFRALPAVAKAMYFPEIFGRTGGDVFMIKQ